MFGFELRHYFTLDFLESFPQNSEDLIEHFFVSFTSRTLINKFKQPFVLILQKEHFLIFKQVNLMIKYFLNRRVQPIWGIRWFDLFVIYLRLDLTANVALQMLLLNQSCKVSTDFIYDVVFSFGQWFILLNLLLKSELLSLLFKCLSYSLHDFLQNFEFLHILLEMLQRVH